MSVLSRMSLSQVLVGTVATVVVAKVARPVLVEAVRIGFKLRDLAAEGYGKAKVELDKVAEDARTPRPEHDVASEISRLQAQVHTLQAQLAAKKA